MYEAPNETSDGTSLDLFNRIATDDLAKVVTTSWGQCEQGPSARRATSAPRRAPSSPAWLLQGQTVVAASGDSGSEDCYNAQSSPTQTELAVDDPGSQPDVLSVGGTTHGQGGSAIAT